jgi:hypothetical protein
MKKPSKTHILTPTEAYRCSKESGAGTYIKTRKKGSSFLLERDLPVNNVSIFLYSVMV